MYSEETSCCYNYFTKLCTKKIAYIFSFQSPNSSYNIVKKLSEDKVDSLDKIIYQIIDIHLINKQNVRDIVTSYPFLDFYSYLITDKSRSKDNAIVVVHIKNKKHKVKENVTNILFSHGNSTDIGYSLNFLIDLSYQLESDIYCFDYSGYGKSTGKPTESTIYKDIATVIDFITVIMPNPIKISSLILYGNSLGSACVINAAYSNYKNIKGIILLSPIASGLKIAFTSYNTNEKEEIDIFCNDSKISSINCPVFIIHGKNDELINITHCINMAKKVKKLKEWYPELGTHNNIPTFYRIEYYKELKQFLHSLTPQNNNEWKNIHCDISYKSTFIDYLPSHSKIRNSRTSIQNNRSKEKNSFTKSNHHKTD